MKMLDRIRRIREPYRMLFIALSTVVVLVVGKTWPNLQYPVWGLFLWALGALLYRDLREPVNYDSMLVANGVVEYVAVGQRHVIRLDEVSKLEFVREEALFPDLEGPYIESKWVVQLRNRSPIEVMDEWPHRRQLLKAFETQWPSFDQQAVKHGLRAFGEGRWLCYEAAPCEA